MQRCPKVLYLGKMMLSGFILNIFSEIFWFLLYTEVIPSEKLSVLVQDFFLEL